LTPKNVHSASKQIPVLALSFHKVYGAVLQVLIINTWNKRPYTEIIDVLNSSLLANYPDLPEAYTHAVLATEEYSDKKIMKLFPRKYTDIRDLHKKISSALVEKVLRPYIESQIKKILLAWQKEQPDTQLYVKMERNVLAKNDTINIHYSNCTPVFRFVKTKNETQYSLLINKDGINISLYKKRFIVLSDNPCIVVLDYQMFYISQIDSKKISPFVNKPYVSVPPSAEKKYFESFVLQTLTNYTVEADGFAVENIHQKPIPKLTFEAIPTDIIGHAFVLRFEYPDSINVFYDDPAAKIVKSKHTKEKFNFRVYHRDKAEENRVAEILKQARLVEKHSSCFIIRQDNKNAPIHRYIEFVRQHLTELLAKGINIQQNFSEKEYSFEPAELTHDVRVDNDWFDIRIVVKIGELSIPFIQLRNNILTEKREFILPNGKIFILPEVWFSYYRSVFLFSQTRDTSLCLPKAMFKVLEDFSGNINTGQAQTTITKLLNDKGGVRNFPLPSGLSATVRSYQHTGFNWLKTLHENTLGACLADDMGLGKTLQTICFLLSLYEKASLKTNTPKAALLQLSLFDDTEEETQDALPPSLIVCPSSIVHNWANELDRFAPQLSYSIYTGKVRNPKAFSGKHIVLTTYGIVRNDIALLSTYDFHYVVLDESQQIRNTESKIYTAVLELKTHNRISLTGTPIENNISDLYAQMNFLNPGILGSYYNFKKTFHVPIERHADEKKKDLLKKLVSPLILRRTRAEVLSELPPLYEQLVMCEPEDEHLKIYETEKSKVRNLLLTEMDSKGKKRSNIIVLQALTRLRLIANHPTLAGLDYEAIGEKTTAIISHLETLVAAGHKVLVFSSFVKHLNLLVKHIEERAWNYAKLTGSTPPQKRQEEIMRFRQQSDLQLFLISLKAGGLGLNLQDASYVIIMDPWWNPAAENQAIARAYRMGQAQSVTVYRFISRLTIEEKIFRLQQSKSALADSFLSSKNPLVSASDAEIEELLS